MHTCMCICACAYVRVHLRASVLRSTGEVDGPRTLTPTRTFTLNPDLNPAPNPNPHSGPNPNLRADDHGEVGGAQREEAQREEHPARAVERAERRRPAVRRHTVCTARPRLARVSRTYSAWRAGAGCPAPLVCTARRRPVGPRSPCVRHGGRRGREAAGGTAQLGAVTCRPARRSASGGRRRPRRGVRSRSRSRLGWWTAEDGVVEGRAVAITPGAPRLRVGRGLDVGWARVGTQLGRSLRVELS